jgi:LacI family transcriptional regulator
MVALDKPSEFPVCSRKVSEKLSAPLSGRPSGVTPTKTRVTRNDVARLARVVPSTVSYVINNGPRSVSLEARERVLKAIAKLGYHPSDVARSLRTQRTQTIGLVIPDITNPYYGEMTQAIEEVSFQHGYTVILAHSSHLPERELRYSHVLRSKQVDGVIFLPVTSDLEPIYFLDRAGIQLVILERVVPGYACIVSDEHYGGYLATRHLLGMGHRKSGCIVLAGDSTSSVARVEGYSAALAEAGIPLARECVVESDYGYAAGELAAHHFLELPDRPTAVVAHNDLIAIGAMKAFMKAGLKVPGDVSVIGFDDIAAASYVQPPLTTIAGRKRQMGRAAIEMLLNLLKAGESVFPGTMKLPVDLIVRESTGPPV